MGEQLQEQQQLLLVMVLLLMMVEQCVKQLPLRLILLYLAQHKHTQSSLAVLSHAIKGINLPEDLYIAGTSKLAYLHKRNNDYTKAIPLWEINASLNIVQAHIELAMYYEHKEGDYQEAMHWALSAVEALSQQSPSPRGTKIKVALEHRISRLKQKIARTTDY